MMPSACTWNNGRGPSRKVNEIDNRGAAFYIALYWAGALGAQSSDTAIKEKFAPVAWQLQEKETVINKELLAAQGQAVDIGGYFLPDPEVAEKQLRPSVALNTIIDSL